MRTVFSIVIVLVIALPSSVTAQDISSESHTVKSVSKELYLRTFDYLNQMIKNDTAYSFKDAVFNVENAYLGGGLDHETYHDLITYYAQIAREFSKRSTLIYEGQDQQAIQTHGAIFNVMTASRPIFLDSGYVLKPDPFTYDFEDFWGERDWTQMFVSKLLDTHKGNCHSLPFLYKILADELGVKAYLSFAPNHTYIKIRSQNPKIGWYNTELTSATFPIDAWIKSSGYVHLDAIRNGVYMDTLSQQQEIAVCMIDLAKGYERKFKDKGDLEFLIKCANTALEYYPNYINAMLLKAETQKKQFESIMKEKGAIHASQVFSDTEAKALFDGMEALYVKIFQLGYRTMPKEMYANWLNDLKEHKDKYANKQLIENTNR